MQGVFLLWLTVLVAATLLGGAAVDARGGGAESCAAPFLELHRRAVDGRRQTAIVLAHTCRQLGRTARFLAPKLPTTLFCGQNTFRNEKAAALIPLGASSTVIMALTDEKVSAPRAAEKMFAWLASSKNKALWKTNFIIWSLSRGGDRGVSELLSLAWKFRIFKLVLASAQRSTVKFFRTISKSGGVCEKSVAPKPTQVGTCTDGKLDFDFGKLKTEVVKNVQGCVLPVATIHFPPSVILFSDHSSTLNFSSSLGRSTEPLGGIEVQIVRTVGRAMNFSARFYAPPDGLGWGVGHENGSFSGLLGELALGRAEMGVGCLMPLPLRQRFFLLSRSYGDRGLAWAVPRPRQLPQWTVLVQVFTPATWTAVAAALLAAVAAIFFFNHPLTDGAFLYVWATILGVSVVEMPRASWTRVLLLGWLAAFLVLSAAYQGALFSFMAKPRYQRALDSLEDIVLNDLPLVGHPNFTDFLENEKSHISAKAHELYKATVDNVLGQMEMMARGGKELACLVNKEMLVWYNYENRHTGKMVHIAKEVATSYPVAAFLRRESALEERFNVLISRLIESGLVEKWYSDLTLYGSKGALDAPQVLKVDNLSGIFLAQALGLLVSIFVFLLEVIVGKYQQMVHIAKEVATSYPVAAFLRRESALEERFNVLISRLIESGLVEKWYSDLTLYGSKGALDAPQVLKLDNLSGIFLAQALGLLVSIFIFLLEVIVGKYQQVSVTAAVML